MTQPIANAVFLRRGKVGKEEEFAHRLETLVLASRSDPGVMTDDLHRSQHGSQFDLDGGTP